MLLPPERGPMSRWCVATLDAGRPAGHPLWSELEDDVLDDDDAQLALWMLHELHYDGFEGVDPALEWDPTLVSVRRELERRLETELRGRTRDLVDEATAASNDVAESIFELCRRDESPSVAAFAHRDADRWQMLEILMHRSVYQLKEADPYTWLIPRLRGRAKTALLDIQYDEYGCGRPEDVHATLFANTLHACGLDAEYGAYVPQAPAVTLAVSNTASMFGLQRRLRGAAAGHFATVEATSSLPSRKMSAGLARLGFPADTTRFFDEHIEADAVHEQIAARDLCGAMVESHPDLRADIIFGSAACLYVEASFSDRVLTAWEERRSSLYEQSPHGQKASPAMLAGRR